MIEVVYGYARVSTPKQRIERQVRNIKQAYPDAIVVTEKYTGVTTNRPAWNRLYKQIERESSADNSVTVVFDEVSRMSRNADEGMALYNDLYSRGVNLIFLKEPHINTSVYREATAISFELTGNEVADEFIKTTNRVMMILARKQIELAFDSAQKEIDYLHKRTSEGVRQAQLKGKQVGREKGAKIETKKAIIAKNTIQKLAKDFGGINTDLEVMAIAGVSRNTYYKYKRELQQSRYACEREE